MDCSKTQSGGQDGDEVAVQICDPPLSHRSPRSSSPHPDVADQTIARVQLSDEKDEPQVPTYLCIPFALLLLPTPDTAKTEQDGVGTFDRGSVL